MEIKTYLNIEYSFERRRYGVAKFFTWLNYRIKGSQDWQSYGDPWPKSRLNRHELVNALNDIVVRVLKPETRVRTILGDAVILGEHGQPGCLAARVEGMRSVMPLHPNSIVEVLA